MESTTADDHVALYLPFTITGSQMIAKKPFVSTSKPFDANLQLFENVKLPLDVLCAKQGGLLGVLLSLNCLLRPVYRTGVVLTPIALIIF